MLDWPGQQRNSGQDQDYLVIETILAILLYGTASQYAPGVMQEVISNRQRWGQLPMELPPTDGYVATLEANLIGSFVYIRPEGADIWEQFLVVDCAGHADGGYAWMLRNNVLVEVDYETAVRWNTVGRGIMVDVLFPKETYNANNDATRTERYTFLPTRRRSREDLHWDRPTRQDKLVDPRRLPRGHVSHGDARWCWPERW